MKKSNYVHALLWVPAVVGSFYLETFWYAKIRYIREVSFFDYRLTLTAVSMLIFTISMLLIYKIQERESKKRESMSKEKQIEEMSCKKCLHYEMCLDNFRGAKEEGLWELTEEDEYFAHADECNFYAAGYRKQSENETLEAVDMFRNLIVNRFIELCNYNDYGKINLLLIGETIDRIYDDVVAKMKGGAE